MDTKTHYPYLLKWGTSYAYGAVALAMKMGYNIVYDPKFKKPLSNLTGAVPLKEWPGMTPQNGGGYEYAFHQVQIQARPILPLSHPLKKASAPRGGKEFAAFWLRHKAALDEVGPFREFTLRY